MQTLGLSSEQRPTDGFLKRLFWPTIENYYDLDLVNQQGFWVCFGVGLLTLILSATTGSPFIGLLIAVIFWLGGMGVRERSIAAAVLVFGCYFVDKIASIEMLVLGRGATGANPVLGLVAMALLLANVRATILARRWRGAEFAETAGELPERSNSTFGDKLVNQLPPRIWPVGRFVFFPLVGLYLLLVVIGMLAMPFLPAKHKAPETPAATY